MRRMVLGTARVKRESEWQDEKETEAGTICARVKDEPESAQEVGASSARPRVPEGVSAAAARAGLYAGHEVKGELVLGPECLQPSDHALEWTYIRAGLEPTSNVSIQSPGEGARTLHGVLLQLKPCFVRLARLPAIDGQTTRGDPVQGLPGCAASKPYSSATSGEQISRKQSFTSHIQTQTSDLDCPKKSNVDNKELSRQTSFSRQQRKLSPNKSTISGAYTGKKSECNNSGISKKHGLVGCEANRTGEKPFTCEICSKKFSHKGTLKEHVRIHSGEKLLQCEICLKQFTYRRALILHIGNHSGNMPFKCAICFKVFPVISRLKEHERIHTGEKPFECEICSKQFITKRILIKHKEVHNEEKQFKCEVCLKEFRQISHLNRHKGVHTKEKPFKCEICSEKFLYMKDWAKHKQIHSADKPFECTMCWKGFTQRYKLKEHELIHTEEKPFQCEICLKQFKFQKCVVKHLATHVGLKPFKCEVCSEQFTRKMSLKVHRRIHTGEKPYQCDICKGWYRQRTTLRLHMRVHMNGIRRRRAPGSPPRCLR